MTERADLVEVIARAQWEFLRGRQPALEPFDETTQNARDSQYALANATVDALAPFLPDPSGIDQAGVSEGIQRIHDVIRIEPRERLVKGLVAWSLLDVPPDGSPTQWCLERLAGLYLDARVEVSLSQKVE